MPPNRKGTFDTVDNLATLNVSQFVETAKYQPLTSSSTTETTNNNDLLLLAKQVLVAEEEKGDEASPQDLANKALIDHILTDERIRQQFSVDHIIEVTTTTRHHDDNTCTTAEEKDNTADVQRAATDHAAAEEERYWDMPTPELGGEVFQVHDASHKKDPSYWDWHNNTKQQETEQVIRKILEEERTRAIFSVDHMEQMIQKDAAALNNNNKKAGTMTGSLSEGLAQPPPQSNDYWNWEAKVHNNNDHEAAEKAAMIQDILEAENLRQQFAVASIEEKLIKEVKASLGTVASNDDYWAGF